MPLNAPIMKISACRKHQASVHVNGADLIEVRVSNHCILLLVKKNLINYVLAIKSDNKKFHFVSKRLNLRHWYLLCIIIILEQLSLFFGIKHCCILCTYMFVTCKKEKCKSKSNAGIYTVSSCKEEI